MTAKRSSTLPDYRGLSARVQIGRFEATDAGLRDMGKSVTRGLAKDSQWVQNHEDLFVLGPDRGGEKFHRLCPGAKSLP
jgi:hypothetical protein